MVAAGSAREDAIMSTPDETQARLDALEAHIAYQNQVIEELSDVAAMQWSEIAELKDRLNRLNNIFQEFEAGMDGEPDQELPPHY